ncbi:Crp/Fnr family transcriptional regulator [Paramagnetospirillum magneticum]|uniref:cAMP-binding protein-catabolite gene activator and regulatory subunit of cAMP-dependent protein kinase n=1 Tax=Paramagnetospirillum magneticum (strain ATCC 700264 / AMB-1) TaxID=342108 RepID=Q2W0D8_PARM1|nr:cyclic nucleotide-binding domain-containing protein [Paramagnetospirillum magneticum]BAE52687.1 cAMP-binding protein - catabolite gene activator and regulatory subunit of cAMP-dependent protein kinase [Paramagnetospirillum magneticum AMB-1]
MNNSARRVVFPKGATVFAEGEPGTTAYVVESGRVSVFKTIKGKRVNIGDVTQGGIFGEMALIDDHPRMASAVAEEETACVIIGKDRLSEQLDKAPKGVKVIVNALLGNIRAMGAELAEATVILSHDGD